MSAVRERPVPRPSRTRGRSSRRPNRRCGSFNRPRVQRRRRMVVGLTLTGFALNVTPDDGPNERPAARLTAAISSVASYHAHHRVPRSPRFVTPWQRRPWRASGSGKRAAADEWRAVAGRRGGSRCVPSRIVGVAGGGVDRTPHSATRLRITDRAGECISAAPYNVCPVVASRYGHGLWFSTWTPFSSANGAQRARRCQSLSEPGSMGTPRSERRSRRWR